MACLKACNIICITQGEHKMTDNQMKYGPNTETVEAFLRHLDGLTKDQRAAVDAAWNAAWDANWKSVSDAAWDATSDAAWNAAWDAAYLKGLAARYAIYEILGAPLIRQCGQSFRFLPMFGFKNPEAVLEQA